VPRMLVVIVVKLILSRSLYKRPNERQGLDTTVRVAWDSDHEVSHLSITWLNDADIGMEEMNLLIEGPSDT
jgi:hypothetical protein